MKPRGNRRNDTFGRSSGIVGLRLYRNPLFDAAAAKRWDVVRYYNDPTYYLDPNARAALSRRNGVRVLPRRTASAESARQRRRTATGATCRRRSATSTCAPGESSATC